jgi:predicted dehydrogenase
MFRIALIGNRAHQNTYGPRFRDHPDCEIVALAEHNAEKADALSKLYGLPCESDYDAVLERDDIDIVCIATDFYLKRTIVPKAAACGKHIFVDKSLARTVAEAREIETGVEGTSVKIHLAYPSRFVPTLSTLADRLRSGVYARPVSYVHHSIRQFPDGDLMEYVSYPTEVKVNGGGELMNLGSHPVDLLHYALGMPKRVYANFETAYWAEFYDPFGTEDVATMLWDYDGLTAHIVTGRNRIQGAAPAAVNIVDVWCEGNHVQATSQTLSENGQRVLDDEGAGGGDGCVQHLIDCIEQDTTPVSGIANGLAVTEITTAGYQSAASGHFVDLPLADERHPMLPDDEQIVEGFLD